MGRHTSMLHQIVYSTKNRNSCLIKEIRQPIFKFIYGILKNKKCHVYRINGVEDHLHILLDIHPTIALSNLVKDLKLGTTDFIKKENLITNFSGWQIGYGAFSYHMDLKDNLIEYIKNQEVHHKTVTFRGEYIALLKEHGVDFEEKYLF